MPKPVSFTRSKKLGDITSDPDIQPWKDDEQAKDKSAQELQGNLERKIQSGQDVTQSDIFSGQTQIGGATSKGYIPETPEAAKQLIREKAGFDIDVDIELRESIHAEYQGKKMSLDVQEKPGVQAKEVAVNISETPTDYTSDVRKPVPSFNVTSEGIVEPQVDRPIGIKSKKPIGIKGMDLATQKKAFRIAEELQSLKIQRAAIVRDINKKLYDINYDADVLTRTDVDKAISVSKGEGITVSEAVLRNKQTATERVAEAGDAFEQKEDWKQTSAYDYSPIEEGNEYRDYEKHVRAERFPMTTIEDRIDATGTRRFQEYPKGGGYGGVTKPALQGKLELSGSGMRGGGVAGLGHLQADLLEESIVPFKTTVVNNVAQVPFAVADYEMQAERILGKQAGKQHMKDIKNPSFQTSADPKAPSAIVSAVKDPDIAKTTPVAPIKEGAAYEALLAKHRKIEAAAAEFAIIRKDVKDIYGSYSKSNLEKYFKGEGLASSGAFRDVRSATIAGVDLNKLNVQGLPAVSKKMENRLASQPGFFEHESSITIDDPKEFASTGGGARLEETVKKIADTGQETDTRYGSGHEVKQEGPAGTKNPQVVVPNPDAPDYNKMEARREAAYKKREISLGGFKQIDDVKKAQKILSTPPVGLSEGDVEIQKSLKKAVAAAGSLKLVKNLGTILNKSNPALNVLSMLPKKTYEDILKKSGIIYKKPQA